jgi:5-methylcytosine-specific restriction endonuclease McrA
MTMARPTKTKAQKQATKRSYQKTYQQKPTQKKAKAVRHKARSEAVKAGRARKGDGMEVDHKKPIRSGGGNGKGNTRVVSRQTNRKKG